MHARGAGNWGSRTVRPVRGSCSHHPWDKEKRVLLKVLKGQRPHNWMEASRVTVQQLEIPGNSGALTPWTTALRPLTEVNSQTAPHPLPLRGPAIAEKQPEAAHAHNKGASYIMAGQDTETQSTCNCPTQANMGSSCSSKERPGATGKSLGSPS